MGQIEDLILQKNWRSMDRLRALLPDNFCQETADAILAWPRGTVLLTTGFYVEGHAETDGPPGTLLLCRALKQSGFHPIVVTDAICHGYFEHWDIQTHYMPLNADDSYCQNLLAQHRPVGLIAIERCGRNIRGVYDDEDMDFERHTAPIDRLFELTDAPTIGIGDGGNEIGMGLLAGQFPPDFPLTPCRVAADHLLIATVSNWGALALAMCLGYFPSQEAFWEVYRVAQSFGYVDGFTAENTLTEDRFPLQVGLTLLEQLYTAVSQP